MLGRRRRLLDYRIIIVESDLDVRTNSYQQSSQFK